MKLASVWSALIFVSSLAGACGGAVDTPSTGGNHPTSNTGSGAPSGNTAAGGPASASGSAPSQPGTSLPSDEGWLPSAGGCGDFQIFAPDQGRRRVLVINGKKELLGITAIGDSASVALGASTDEEARVRVDVYDGRGGGNHYCTDEGTLSPKLTNSFKAISGNATFTISAVAKEGGLYSLDVTLTGVVVEHDDGSGTELIPDATFKDVKVGWFPG